MMQITDRSVEDKTWPLFRLGFRPFFLVGTAYGAWALLRWVLILSGAMSWEHETPVTAWHSHELLFGFGVAIVVGFLTTAVQNWTGTRGLNGMPLVGLFSLWLSARVVINLYPDTVVWVIADALFMVLAALVIGRQVIHAKNYRNLVFVPVFALFIALHLGQSWAMGGDVILARELGFATIWVFALLISLLGGRVLPFFIERRLNDKLPRDTVPLILGAQLPLLALALLSLFSNAVLAIQGAATLALLFHGVRLIRWYRNGIWQEPLLWSLYLSYACLPLALALLAYSGEQQLSLVMHLLSVGLMGGMIMAMMCRVSLGHTGRPLKAHFVAVISISSILLAAASRVALPWIEPSWTVLSYKLTGLFWLLSLVSFLWVYVPILSRPRADGQIG